MSRSNYCVNKQVEIIRKRIQLACHLARSVPRTAMAVGSVVFALWSSNNRQLMKIFIYIHLWFRGFILLLYRK